MTFLEFLNSLRRRWLFVVVAVVLGGGIGTAAFVYATPMYQSSASVYFSVPMATSGNDLAQGGDYTQAQLASYAALATKPIVLQPVITELRLRTTPQKLSDFVAATVSNNTVLTTITVTNSDPHEAAVIANGVADQLGKTVRQLSPRSATGDSVVDYAIAGRAVVPQFASSPKKKIDLGAGLLGGLIIGVIAALAKDRLDTRVRDEVHLGELPALARIPFDRSSAKRGRSPLITDWADGSARPEAFRQLRTALQFVDVDDPMGVIAVTSSGAAEGKSGVSANLAVAFAEAGHRVLLIDADLRRPSIADYFGLEGSVGLTNILAGQVDRADVIQEWGHGRSLAILASGSVPPNPSELLGSVRMRDLLGKLRAEYDMIVIDTPPLLPVTDAAVVSVKADGVIVVARYGWTKKPAMARAVNALRSVDAKVVGAVINRAPAKGRRDGYSYYGATVRNDEPLGPLPDVIEPDDVDRSPEHAASDADARRSEIDAAQRNLHLADELRTARAGRAHIASTAAH